MKLVQSSHTADYAHMRSLCLMVKCAKYLSHSSFAIVDMYSVFEDNVQNVYFTWFMKIGICVSSGKLNGD